MRPTIRCVNFVGRFPSLTQMVLNISTGQQRRHMTTTSTAGILREEERIAVQRGLANLSQRDRTLLGLLSADPPVSYGTISTQLGIPVGSIGPTRARCLSKLAATEPVRALVEVAALMRLTPWSSLF